jgi:hypothetical protein
LGTRAVADGVGPLRQSEVQHLYLAFGSDLDIAGLEVAMSDALLVLSFEGVGDLARVIECSFKLSMANS